MIADPSSFPSDAGSQRLAAFIVESERVAQMNDLELAQAIIDEVLSAVRDREEVLVVELLSRFEEMAGIERDDEGRVIQTEDQS